MQCPFLVSYYNIPLLFMLIPFQSPLDIISSPKLKGQSHHNVHSSVHWTIKHKNRYNYFPRISPTNIQIPTIHSLFLVPVHIFLFIIIVHMWSCLVCIGISITNVTDTFLVWTNDAQKHPKLASKYNFPTSAVYKTLLQIPVCSSAPDPCPSFILISSHYDHQCRSIRVPVNSIRGSCGI